MRHLAEAGAVPILTLEDGTTPLMAPLSMKTRRPGSDPAQAENSTLEAVRTAVELGVNVNALNETGNAALHYAASRQLDSVVEFLVSRGARLNVKNDGGQTPLAMTAIQERRLGQGPQPDDRAKRTAELLRRLGAKE